MLKWHAPAIYPEHNECCFVVINDQIVLDVFSFDAQNNLFTLGNMGNLHGCPGIHFSEIQAWSYAKDIEKPDFLCIQLDTRADSIRDSLNISRKYREKNGDLFGNVIDPDDVNINI